MQGRRRPVIHRRVIGRCLGNFDMIVVRHDPEEQEEHAGTRCHFVGMS